MFWEVLAQPGFVILAVAGLAMLAVATWLVVLDIGNRLHQAFAFFLVVRGLFNLVFPLLFHPDPQWHAYADRVMGYFSIALPFASLMFAALFWQKYAGGRVGRRIALVLALVMIAAEFAYAAGASWLGGPARIQEAGGPQFVFDWASPGPWFVAARDASYGVAALALAWRIPRAASGPERTSLLLVATGFMLYPVAMGTWAILAFATPGAPDTGIPTLDELPLAASLWTSCALILVALWRIRGAGVRGGTDGRGVRRTYWAVGVAAASAVPAWLAALAAGGGSSVLTFVDGVWTLALPVLVAYALARHQLFDARIKARFALKQGTVGAIFVAVFFVVSELAAQFFTDRTSSPVWGVVAAGALLLFIMPLQSVGERIAASCFGPTKRIDELDATGRRAFYRDQLALAWSDGSLDIKERRMLEVARQRLGLSHEEAARAERDVTSSSGPRA